MWKLAVVVHLPRTTQNMFISRPCFAEDGKEMYKKQTCTATVLLNSDVLDAIVVVVCLSGLFSSSSKGERDREPCWPRKWEEKPWQGFFSMHARVSFPMNTVLRLVDHRGTWAPLNINWRGAQAVVTSTCQMVIRHFRLAAFLQNVPELSGV